MLTIWYPPKRLSNSCRGPPPTQRRAPGRTAEPNRLRVRRCRDGRHRQMAPLPCAGPVFQCRRSSTCSSTFQRPILTKIVRRTDSTIETAIIMRHPKPPPSGRTLTGLTAQPWVLLTRLRQSPLRPFHSAASVGARSGSTAGPSPGSGAGALSGLGSLGRLSHDDCVPLTERRTQCRAGPPNSVASRTVPFCLATLRQLSQQPRDIRRGHGDDSGG